MRSNVAIWMAPLILVAFAGCLTGDEGYHVYATGGKFAIGFAYDGKGVEGFAGPAYLDLNEGANTGVFVAQGKVAGTDYRIVFEDFAEAAGKKFHNGGIAADFREHGASGVGDKTIPEVDLEMAGWGLATITTGGSKLYKDPISGKDQWAAHLMVIRNGVRNDTSSQIHTTDHKVYGPEHAASGLSTPGDYELHLVLRNQTANGSAAASQFGPFPTTAPTPSAQYTARHTFAVSSPGSAVTIDLSVGGTGATASNLSFTVLDPTGDQVLRRSMGPGMVPVAASSATAQLRFTAGEVGDFVVQVSGRLSPGNTYSVRGVVTPPPSVVLNFWWEDLQFGAEAEGLGDSSGMLEGTKFHGTHEHPAASGSGTMSPRKFR